MPSNIVPVTCLSEQTPSCGAQLVFLAGRAGSIPRPASTQVRTQLVSARLQAISIRKLAPLSPPASPAAVDQHLGPNWKPAGTFGSATTPGLCPKEARPKWPQANDWLARRREICCSCDQWRRLLLVISNSDEVMWRPVSKFGPATKLRSGHAERWPRREADIKLFIYRMAIPQHYIVHISLIHVVRPPQTTWSRAVKNFTYTHMAPQIWSCGVAGGRVDMAWLLQDGSAMQPPDQCNDSLGLLSRELAVWTRALITGQLGFRLPVEASKVVPVSQTTSNSNVIVDDTGLRDSICCSHSVAPLWSVCLQAILVNSSPRSVGSLCRPAPNAQPLQPPPQTPNSNERGATPIMTDRPSRLEAFIKALLASKPPPPPGHSPMAYDLLTRKLGCSSLSFKSPEQPTTPASRRRSYKAGVRHRPLWPVRPAAWFAMFSAILTELWAVTGRHPFGKDEMAGGAYIFIHIHEPHAATQRRRHWACNPCTRPEHTTNHRVSQHSTPPHVNSVRPCLRDSRRHLPTFKHGSSSSPEKREKRQGRGSRPGHRPLPAQTVLSPHSALPSPPAAPEVIPHTISPRLASWQTSGSRKGRPPGTS
ncbi:hypothetical protein IF1G_06078 [Cordyceps javanica]|uniref:Uncharacterized protein n=1 Tax=Cordyceps javanica TaxID=43265 RepID=A0A545V048_9HYPO|nr:hypothetical protein IF1G_06078 [Cordyceps javanica]